MLFLHYNNQLQPDHYILLQSCIHSQNSYIAGLCILPVTHSTSATAYQWMDIPSVCLSVCLSVKHPVFHLHYCQVIFVESYRNKYNYSSPSVSNVSTIEARKQDTESTKTPAHHKQVFRGWPVHSQIILMPCYRPAHSATQMPPEGTQTGPASRFPVPQTHSLHRPSHMHGPRQTSPCFPARTAPAHRPFRP